MEGLIKGNNESNLIIYISLGFLILLIGLLIWHVIRSIVVLNRLNHKQKNSSGSGNGSGYVGRGTKFDTTSSMPIYVWGRRLTYWLLVINIIWCVLYSINGFDVAHKIGCSTFFGLLYLCFISGKICLFSLFVLRLKTVYVGVHLQMQSKKSFWIVYILIGVWVVLAFLATAIRVVPLSYWNDDGKICDYDYTSWQDFIFLFLLLVLEFAIHILCLFLFMAPVRQIIQSVKEVGLISGENRLSHLLVKYSTLVLFLLVVMSITAVLVMLMNQLVFYLIEGWANCLCVVLMAKVHERAYHWCCYGCHHCMKRCMGDKSNSELDRASQFNDAI